MKFIPIQMRKLLFLTSHNFATNPRLVKEIKLSIKQNFHIQVICFEFRNWSYEINRQIKKELQDAGVLIHSIEAGRTHFMEWILSVIREKSSRWFCSIFSNHISITADAVSRRTGLLISHLKYIEKVDLVIGHNTAALLPTIVAGKKFNCRKGFDIEDYHPGEGSNSYVSNLTKKLMIYTLPEMDYVSFASPLIMQEVKKDVNTGYANWFPLLNYTFLSEFDIPENIKEGVVKLVWFSQNINKGRGIELILPYIKKHQHTIELHLIGHINPEYFNNYLKGYTNIAIHQPLPQKDLHTFLANFDIGLALEPAKDLNNELAVSNKILAYLQAGLFVIATDTPAQKLILQEYPEHGNYFNALPGDMEKVFSYVIDNIVLIRNRKTKRYHDFKKNNWEYASEILLNAWMPGAINK